MDAEMASVSARMRWMLSDRFGHAGIFIVIFMIIFIMLNAWAGLSCTFSLFAFATVTISTPSICRTAA
ncbi:MAG: hypothetical protein HON77_06125 [Gammaproteobacteria bacterium]|jgi:hypothetical protein|nr:hypothetical protein [Gammaproteobacteria bacterium]MBT6583867.1 hypothetical protein [Gammaproteobacteria bacterium]